MARNSVKRPKGFDEILAWLDPDREVAGNVYVQLRHDLAKIFVWNHCPDPEGLTDEVFDRVAEKVHHLRHTFEGDPKLFFYGVARNLVKESAKKIRTRASFDDIEVVAAPTGEAEDEMAHQREDCLHYCLQELSTENRELILAYYAKEKQAKIDHRAEIACQLGITVEALRVRAHRIRGAIEECIERCLDRKAH
jgi:RNA polymerase sigma factor (sigma-70 family)